MVMLIQNCLGLTHQPIEMGVVADPESQLETPVDQNSNEIPYVCPINRALISPLDPEDGRPLEQRKGSEGTDWFPRASLEPQYDVNSHRSLPMSLDSDHSNSLEEHSILGDPRCFIIGISVFIFIIRIMAMVLICYADQFNNFQPQQNLEGYHQTSDDPGYTQVSQTRNRHSNYGILTYCIMVFLIYGGSCLVSIRLCRSVRKYLKEAQTVHKLCSVLGLAFDMFLVGVLYYALAMEKIAAITSDRSSWVERLNYYVNLLSFSLLISWTTVFPISLSLCRMRKNIDQPNKQKPVSKCCERFIQTISQMLQCTREQVIQPNSEKEKLKEPMPSPPPDVEDELQHLLASLINFNPVKSNRFSRLPTRHTI